MAKELDRTDKFTPHDMLAARLLVRSAGVWDKYKLDSDYSIASTAKIDFSPIDAGYTPGQGFIPALRQLYSDKMGAPANCQPESAGVNNADIYIYIHYSGTPNIEAEGGGGYERIAHLTVRMKNEARKKIASHIILEEKDIDVKKHGKGYE